VVLGVLVLALFGWMVLSGNTRPQLGLDLRGGTTVTLQPKVAPGETGAITQDAIDQAVSIIQARVNGFGVAEAEVASQGRGANAVIVVSVPGVTQGELVDLLGRTARLAFRPVLQETAGTPAPTSPTPTPSATKTGKKKQGGASSGGLVPRTEDSASPTPSPSPSPTASTAATPSPSPSAAATPSTAGNGGEVTPALQAQFAALDCSAENQRSIGANYAPEDAIVACSEDGAAKYLLGPVAVDGSTIADATAGIPPNELGWAVQLRFDSEGSKLFADTTQKLFGQQPPQNQFAIVLDGQVVSAPRVNEPILGGQASITGDFTQQQATDLATVLKFGALPLAFDIGERQTVSPTLGADQLRAGLLAGALGLVLVVVYLLMYYRALALVAVFSLVVAGAITYGTVVFLGATSFGFTLTLAGVAGLIVAIGITADSFIVYFERIRDEVRDGRTLRVALEAGWTRAKRTIISADAISLIAAVILYVLSVGSVRGFAFALGLTTVVDLLVVFTFTKPLITMLAHTAFFNSGSAWSGLSPERLGSRRPAAKPAASTKEV
jgi:preprotein translocase subunit SecD